MDNETLKRIERRLDAQERATKLVMHELGGAQTSLINHLVLQSAEASSLTELLDYLEVRYGKIELTDAAQERVKAQVENAQNLVKEMTEAVNSVEWQIQDILRGGRSST